MKMKHGLCVVHGTTFSNRSLELVFHMTQLDRPALSRLAQTEAISVKVRRIAPLLHRIASHKHIIRQIPTSLLRPRLDISEEVKPTRPVSKSRDIYMHVSACSFHLLHLSITIRNILSISPIYQSGRLAINLGLDRLPFITPIFKSGYVTPSSIKMSQYYDYSRVSSDFFVSIYRC